MYTTDFDLKLFYFAIYSRISLVKDLSNFCSQIFISVFFPQLNFLVILSLFYYFFNIYDNIQKLFPSFHKSNLSNLIFIMNFINFEVSNWKMKKVSTYFSLFIRKYLDSEQNGRDSGSKYLQSDHEGVSPQVCRWVWVREAMFNSWQHTFSSNPPTNHG